MQFPGLGAAGSIGPRTRSIPTTLTLAGWFAIGAAAVHVLATLAGSVLDPSYSQVRQHVSDLTATGAST